MSESVGIRNRRLLTRRCALSLGGASMSMLAAGWPLSSLAQSRLAQARITVQPSSEFKPMPIAIPDFLPGSAAEGDMPRNITQIITNNLSRSALFAPIDQAAYIEKITDFNATPRFPDWRTINAQALLVGHVTRQPDGRIRVMFRLWDVNGGSQLTGQQFMTPTDNWRRIGHIISDMVYERLTGEKGYFDTRVVFVDETGTKEQRDQTPRHHGSGRRQRALSDARPGSRAYATLLADHAGDHLHVVRAGRPARLPAQHRNGPARDRRQFSWHDVLAAVLTGRPARDHESVAGRQRQYLLMDLRSKATTRLTDAAAIDTAPSYSPDGSRICFESDRGGKQQIYVMGANGGAAQRISFGDGAYSTPVWSPRGDTIAFTKQFQGRFAIGVMNPDGSGERILTEGFHNEGPTWAPNGRVLMFFRDPGGNAGPSLFTVDLTGRNELRVQTPGYASDPAWSPLLSS